MSADIMYHLIGCDNPCAPNFLRHLRELPIDSYMGSNEDLLDWTIELHNIVNIETGKPSLTSDRLDNIKAWYLPKKIGNEPCSICDAERAELHADNSNVYRRGVSKLNISKTAVSVKYNFKNKH
jgi:hypothetical protein